MMASRERKSDRRLALTGSLRSLTLPARQNITRTAAEHDMNRTTFRVLVSSCLAIFAATSVSAAEPPPDKRPNILFAMADDWAWPHAGAYGDKVIKTPTFDRVAKEGVLFSHVFSVTPSCTASRAAVLTGQWAHRLEEAGNL